MFFPRVTENDYDTLTTMCQDKLNDLFGASIPEDVKERLCNELTIVEKYNLAIHFHIAHYFANESLKLGLPATFCNDYSSTYIAYLLNITKTNPLDPYYYCKTCKEMTSAPDAASGYDLPAKVCLQCGKAMKGDGHRKPLGSFTGLNRMNGTYMDISLAPMVYEMASDILCSLFPNDRVIAAGIGSTFGEGRISSKCYVILPAECRDDISATEVVCDDGSKMEITTAMGNDLSSDYLVLCIYEHSFTSIYDFFRSTDIAGHCKNINYQFRPLEIAIMIHHSDKPITEQHEAYWRIIYQYPDMPIPKTIRFEDGYDSLHAYLREHIAHENRAIEQFVLAKEGEAYFTTVVCDNEFSSKHDVECCFSSFEMAKDAVKNMWSDEARNRSIEKRGVNGVELHWCKCIINPDREMVWLFWAEDDGFENRLRTLVFDLPHPFERGDLVIVNDRVPMVFDKIYDDRSSYSEEKYKDRITGRYADDGIIHVGCYKMRGRDGYLDSVSDIGFDGLSSLRYYRGVLTRQDRFLRYLGWFLKGKDCDPASLIAKYMMFYTEAQNEKWEETHHWKGIGFPKTDF